MGKRRKTSNPNLAAQNGEQGTADRSTTPVKPPRRPKKEPKQSEGVDTLQTRSSLGNEKTSTESQGPTTVKGSMDSDVGGKTSKQPRAPKRRRLPEPPSGVPLKDDLVGIRKNMARKSSPKRRANIRKLPQPESDKKNRKTEEASAKNTKPISIAASKGRSLPQPPLNQATVGKRVTTSAGQFAKRQRHWTRKHLYRLAKAGRTLLTKAPRCCLAKQVSLSDLNKEQTTEQRGSDSFDGPAKSAKYKVTTNVATSSSDEDEDAIKIKRKEEFLRSAKVGQGYQPKKKQTSKRKKRKNDANEEEVEIQITGKDTPSKCLLGDPKSTDSTQSKESSLDQPQKVIERIISTCQTVKQDESYVEQRGSKQGRRWHPVPEEVDPVSENEKTTLGTSVIKDQKEVTESPIKKIGRSPRQRRRMKPVPVIVSEDTVRHSPEESTTHHKNISKGDSNPNGTTESAVIKSPTLEKIKSPRPRKTPSKADSKDHIQTPHVETDKLEDVPEAETDPNKNTLVAIAHTRKDSSPRPRRRKKSKMIEADQKQQLPTAVKDENTTEGDTDRTESTLRRDRRKIITDLPIKTERSPTQRRHMTSATLIVPDDKIRLPLTETVEEENVTRVETEPKETIVDADQGKAVGEPPIKNLRRLTKQRRHKKSETTVVSEENAQPQREAAKDDNVTKAETGPADTTLEADHRKAVAEPPIKNHRRSAEQRRRKMSETMVVSEDNVHPPREAAKEENVTKSETVPTETTLDADLRTAAAEPAIKNLRRSKKQRRHKKSETMVVCEENVHQLEDTTKEENVSKAETEPTKTTLDADLRKAAAEPPMKNTLRSTKQSRRKKSETLVVSEDNVQPPREAAKEENLTKAETGPTETTLDADFRKAAAEPPTNNFRRSVKQRRHKKSETMVVSEENAQPQREAAKDDSVTKPETGPADTTLEGDQRKPVAEPPINNPRRSAEQRRRKMSETMVVSEENVQPQREAAKEEVADLRKATAEPPINNLRRSAKQRRHKKSETMVVSGENVHQLGEAAKEENVLKSETEPTETTLDTDLKKAAAEPPITSLRRSAKQMRHKKSETMVVSGENVHQLREAAKEENVLKAESEPKETTLDTDLRKAAAEPPIKNTLRSTKQRRRKKSETLVASEDNVHPPREAAKEENVTKAETEPTATTLDADLRKAAAEPPFNFRRSAKQRRYKKSETMIVSEENVPQLGEAAKEENVPEAETGPAKTTLDADNRRVETPIQTSGRSAKQRQRKKSESVVVSEDCVQPLREAAKDGNMTKAETGPAETTRDGDHTKTIVEPPRKNPRRSPKQRRRKRSEISENHIQQPLPETAKEGNVAMPELEPTETTIGGGHRIRSAESLNNIPRRSPKERRRKKSAAMIVSEDHKEQELIKEESVKTDIESKDGKSPNKKASWFSRHRRHRQSKAATSLEEQTEKQPTEASEGRNVTERDNVPKETTPNRDHNKAADISSVKKTSDSPKQRRCKQSRAVDGAEISGGHPSELECKDSEGGKQRPASTQDKTGGKITNFAPDINCENRPIKPPRRQRRSKQSNGTQAIAENGNECLKTPPASEISTGTRHGGKQKDAAECKKHCAIKAENQPGVEITCSRTSSFDVKLGTAQVIFEKETLTKDVSYICPGNSDTITDQRDPKPAFQTESKHVMEVASTNSWDSSSEDESSENSFSDTWKDLVKEIAPKESRLSSRHARLTNNAKKQVDSRHKTKASSLAKEVPDLCDEKTPADTPKEVTSKKSFSKTKTYYKDEQMLQTCSNTKDKKVVRNHKDAEVVDGSLSIESGTASTPKNCQFHVLNGNDGSMSLNDMVDLELAQMEAASKTEGSLNATTINPTENSQPPCDDSTHIDDGSISNLVDLELARMVAPREDDPRNDELADNSWDDSFSETWKNLVDEIAPRKRQLSKQVPRSASAAEVKSEQTMQCRTVESRAPMPKTQNKKEDSESDSWDDSFIQKIAPKRPKAITGKKGIHSQGESNARDRKQEGKTTREFENAIRNDAVDDICAEQIPSSQREKAPELHQTGNVVVSNSGSMDDIASLASFDEVNDFAKTNPNADCVPPVSKSSSRECRKDTISPPFVESVKQVPSTSIIGKDCVGEVTRLSERTKVVIGAAENTSSADRASFPDEDQENVTKGKSLLKIKQLSSEEEDSVISWGPLDNRGKSVSNTTIRTIGVLPIKDQPIDNTSKTISPNKAKPPSPHETVSVLSQGRTDEKVSGKGKGNQPKIGPMDRSSYLAALEKNETKMETNADETPAQNKERVKQNEIPMPSVKKKKGIFRWKKRGKSLFKLAPKVDKKGCKTKTHLQESMIVDQSASTSQALQEAAGTDDEPDSESKPEGPLLTKSSRAKNSSELLLEPDHEVGGTEKTDSAVKDGNELCTEDNTGFLNNSDKISDAISAWSSDKAAKVKENPFSTEYPDLFQKKRKSRRAKGIFSKLKHRKKKANVTKVKDIRNLLIQDSDSEKSLGKGTKTGSKKNIFRVKKQKIGKKVKTVRRFNGRVRLVKINEGSDEDQRTEKAMTISGSAETMTGGREKSRKRIKRAFKLFGRSRVQNSPDLFNEDKHREHARETEPPKEGMAPTSSSLIAVLSEIEKELPDISDSLIVEKQKDNETREQLSKKEMKALKKKEKKEAKARRKKEKKELKELKSKTPIPSSVTDAPSKISVQKRVQDNNDTVNKDKGPILVREAEPQKEGKDSTSSSLIAVLSEIEKELPDISKSPNEDKEKDNDNGTHEQLSKKEIKALRKKEKKEAKAQRKREKKKLKEQKSKAPIPSAETDVPSEISVQKQVEDSKDTDSVDKEPEHETQEQLSKKEMKSLKKKEKKEAKAREKEEKKKLKEPESKAPVPSSETDAPSEISVQKQVEDSNDTVNEDKEPEHDAQEQLSKKEIKAMKKKERKEAKAQKKEEKKEAKARKEEEKKETKTRKEEEKKEAKARKEEEKKELKTEHSTTPAPSSVTDTLSKTSIETQERKEKVKAAKKIGALFKNLTHSKVKDPDHRQVEEQEKYEKGSRDKMKTKKGSKSSQEEPEGPDTDRTQPELETATSDKSPSLSDNGEGQQTPNISKATKIMDTLRSITRISSDVTIGEEEELDSAPEKKASKPKLVKYKRSAVTDAYYSLQHELDGLAGKVRRNRINLRNKWRDFKAERADKKK